MSDEHSEEWRVTVESLEADRQQWMARAEAAEARSEANFQALQESEAELARTQDRAEAAEAALAEARAKAEEWRQEFRRSEADRHELSVKYTVALDQNREMGQALRAAEPYLSGIEPRTAWHKVRATLGFDAL
jgi:chromosome segregation ATPase